MPLKSVWTSRGRWWILFGGGGAILAAVIIVMIFRSHGQSRFASIQAAYAAEAAVPLAQGTEVGLPFAPYGDLRSGGQGKPVDGVDLNSMEADTYHTHVHLSLYLNGKQAAIPAGIGILPPYMGSANVFIDGGAAFYWIHTHDNTGIIHIETPGRRNFTLGQFFGIWGVSISADHFQNVKLPVTAFVGGTHYAGNFLDIPLTPHKQITLEVGSPLAVPAKYTFPQDLLATEKY